MKVITDFGIQELKPKKVFEMFNEKFAIVNLPRKYYNSDEPVLVRTVIHCDTGTPMPSFSFQHKETLKISLEKSISGIESIYKRIGEEKFRSEINKCNKINLD